MVKRNFTIFFFSIILYSCGYDYKEILRITNADGSIDAVAIDLLTGATVATPTKIYVGDKGFEIKGEPVFVADYVEGLGMVWDGAHLVIRAKRARVFLLVNTVDVESDEGAKKISITLEVLNKIEV